MDRLTAWALALALALAGPCFGQGGGGSAKGNPGGGGGSGGGEGQASALAGRWVMADQFSRQELLFLPDGRYRRRFVIGEIEVGSRGRWEVQDSAMTLRAPGEMPAEIAFALEDGGARLALRENGPAGTFQRWDKAPGSDAPSALAEAWDEGGAPASFEGGSAGWAPSAGEPFPSAGLPALGAPAADLSGGDPAALVGRWIMEDQIARRELVFLPDGRYGSRFVVGEYDVNSGGRYEVRGATATLRPRGEPPVDHAFGFEQGGTVLAAAGPDGIVLRYAKEPGSETAVIAEARAADALKAAEDDAWRARIPAAPARPGLVMAVGEVPADANPLAALATFPGATVFAEQELYVWFSAFSTAMASPGGYSLGEFRDSAKWFFYPNGRCYAKMTNYSTATTLDGNVVASWGSYRLEPASGSAPERLEMLFDTGERLEFEAIDWRRNLRSGDSVYGNIEWENEAFAQALQ